MKVYQLDIPQIESAYKTDAKNGLNHTLEADMVSKENGILNFIFCAFKECKAKFSYVHIVALICFSISMIFSILNQTWALFGCCLASLFLLILLFFIECGALRHLKNKYFNHIKACDENVVVIRNSLKQTVAVSQLQIGDVVVLEEGTVLRGDARIIASNRLFADESLVFGKTIPVAKDFNVVEGENVLPEDQKNMLWKGSFIASGSGSAIIVALDEDCYIYKTGGREKRGQRSCVYNRRNNIGKILSLAFLLICILLFLIAAIFSGRWVETVAILGALMVLICLEPVSCITEWNYYYSAQKLYAQGALVRNIEVFDGINKEQDVYFDGNALIDGQLNYRDTIVLEGDEKTILSYFALSTDEKLIDSLDPALKNFDLSHQKIAKMMPVFRKEEDPSANSFCLFTDEGNSMLVASGYWKKMLSYVALPEEDLLNIADELEIHGKMVYLIASKKMGLIPGSLSADAMAGGLKPIAFIVFDIANNDQMYQMISRFKRSGMRAHLIHTYSDNFSKNLCKLYDMDDVVSTVPGKKSYSVPGAGSNVVFNDASMIEKEEASLILTRGTMPQKILYAVKCMFCGIDRCLNFIGIISAFLLFSVFILIFKEVPAQSLLFPLLLFQPILIGLCYFLAETVRNCNQSKRSLWMGGLFGAPILIAALIGCDMALLVPGLSVILYAVVLWVGALKHRGFQPMDLIVIAVILILALLPWFFIGGNWLVAVLFSVFPAAAAFILDLIY